MEINKLRSRLEVIRTQKHLQKQEFASILGITEQKYSNIIHGRYSGSFEEYEKFIDILGESDDDKLYLATGKHLPKPTEQTQIPPHLAGFHEKMLKAMLDLTIELKGLKEEIKNLKEVSTHQGEILEHLKIPEP